MAPQLTQADISGLLNSPSEDARAQIAAKVGGQIDAGGLSGQERILAKDILRLMVQDAASLVRSAVAESLANTHDIPDDVAAALANDIDEIAVPFLEVSPAISDEDLISIVRGGSGAKSLAIAGRKTVSAAVSDTIAQVGGREAVSCMLSNPGADIEPTSYGHVLDRWQDDEDVAQRMAERELLPLNVSERLVALVSDEVKQRLMSRHGIGSDLADRMALEAREAATIKLIDGLPSIDDFSTLMQHLETSGRLSGSLVVRAACMGEMRFVEHALAQMARIDPRRAWTLVHDAGRLGLRALFQQAKLPQHLYLPLRVAVDVFHEMSLHGEIDDRARFRRATLERVLTQTDGLKNDDMDFLLYQMSRQDAAPSQFVALSA
ncbi:MAG: DUF2336 domain-containing protein [Candidatus Phaeomarinobacter sp.]